jgi:hypothetical protein
LTQRRKKHDEEESNKVKRRVVARCENESNNAM